MFKKLVDAIKEKLEPEKVDPEKVKPIPLYKILEVNEDKIDAVTAYELAYKKKMDKEKIREQEYIKYIKGKKIEIEKEINANVEKGYFSVGISFSLYNGNDEKKTIEYIHKYIEKDYLDRNFKVRTITRDFMFESEVILIVSWEGVK